MLEKQLRVPRRHIFSPPTLHPATVPNKESQKWPRRQVMAWLWDRGYGLLQPFKDGRPKRPKIKWNEIPLWEPGTSESQGSLSLMPCQKLRDRRRKGRTILLTEF
jgi:hypothetical protein